jgi:hypothetical protein
MPGNSPIGRAKEPNLWQYWELHPKLPILQSWPKEENTLDPSPGAPLLLLVPGPLWPVLELSASRSDSDNAFLMHPL